MTTIAVLGAGAGGAAATVELMQNGHKIRLWNRSAATLQPFQDGAGVGYAGVLGEGRVEPELVSDNLQAVLDNADGILVCLPTLAHESLAATLAKLGSSSLPVVLNPGHTGGAMEFHQSYRERGVTPPPIAEFSTLTYVARKLSADTVTVTGAAKQVRVAGMAGSTAAVQLAQSLFSSAVSNEDVIATSLSNVNLVLHPPGCVLGAAWVEATGGDFTFYVDGMTDGVGQVMQQLDNERRRVAYAFGHSLPPLAEEMFAIGTVDGLDAETSLTEKIRSGTANRRIKAPDSLAHRYYMEDFWYGLTPFIALAEAAGEVVPVATSLMTMVAALQGKLDSPVGRTSERMGIQGLTKQQIIDFVRGNN